MVRGSGALTGASGDGPSRPGTGSVSRGTSRTGVDYGDSDDDSDDDPEDADDEYGGEPTVLCGDCGAYFGSCACVLSPSPCYTPGRWTCTFVDATTPLGETAVGLASNVSSAVNAAHHGTTTNALGMLLTYRAHGVVESVVA